MTHHRLPGGQEDTCDGCGVETADNTGWTRTYTADGAWDVTPVHLCPACTPEGEVAA